MSSKLLSEAGKEDLALALILLKDFKSEGKMDIDVSLQILSLAQYLGVATEFNNLLCKIPPMRIEPRYK